MPDCTFVLTFLKQERHFSGMCLCLYDKGSMCARVCACNYDVDMMLLSLLKAKIRESKHLDNLDSKIMSLFFGLSVVRVGVWRDRCSISMQLEQRSITDLFTCKVLNCCSVSLSCGYYHPASVSWSVCATGPPTAERIPCSSGRTNHRPAGALKSHKWPPRLGFWLFFMDITLLPKCLPMSGEAWKWQTSEEAAARVWKWETMFPQDRESASAPAAPIHACYFWERRMFAISGLWSLQVHLLPVGHLATTKGSSLVGWPLMCF